MKYKRDLLRNAFTECFSVGNRFEFDMSEDGEDWSVLQIGGFPQEPYSCSCEHDCCGHVFCRNVISYFGGFITIGRYGVNV